MKVFKAAIHFDDESGELPIADVVFWLERYWLVPWWIESPLEGLTRPARLVPLDAFAPQSTPEYPAYDFLLHKPVPRSFFQAHVPSSLMRQYAAIDRPPIEIAGPAGLH